MQSQSILLLSANPIVTRFLSKVHIPDDPDACWEWKLHKDRDGYGMFSVKTKPVKAHRMAYSLFKGEIPPGMCVCHTCDNRACPNPRHLWLGTSAENTQDKITKGREARGESQSRITKETTPRGNKHGMTKLPDEELPDVFKLRTFGMSQEEIAIALGVSQGLIGGILRGVYRVNRQ
jgi:HNH endonuclease